MRHTRCRYNNDSLMRSELLLCVFMLLCQVLETLKEPTPGASEAPTEATHEVGGVFFMVHGFLPSWIGTLVCRVMVC